MFSKNRHPWAWPNAGFGLTETLVSLTAGAVIISASALALNSTRSLINNSKTRANLRQNSSNGVSLLRAEVERSLHVLIDSDTTPSGLEHTDLYNNEYASSHEICQQEANKHNEVFKPVFGLKMADVNDLIIYGLSDNNAKYESHELQAQGYTLKRCGSPLGADGRYMNNEIRLATVIDEIGALPCWEEIGSKLCKEDQDEPNYREIVQKLDVKFVDDRTPIREFGEPALRIATDKNRKLIRFIDPNADERDGSTSYLEKSQAIGRPITENLYFASYARADKRLRVGRENQIVFNGAYFRDVSSKNINILVDGSGSMSACILWGTGDGEKRRYWNGKTYMRTSDNCSLTRMESLQHELITLLGDLPDDTKITLQSFSSPGGVNHRSWSESKNGAVVIGEPGNRDSAIAFVNSLDDEPKPYRWGETDPWDGLNFAFNLDETDTLYFLSDGEPTENHAGESWQSSDFSSTIQYYISLNNSRTNPLKVNTIAIELQAPWMESLSRQTTGDHLEIDNNKTESSEG